MPRLVIGCGNAHAHHNHALDVTMDNDATMHPTIVGSITDPVSGLINNPTYRRFFTIIVTAQVARPEAVSGRS
jgi:hypothetical protein